MPNESFEFVRFLLYILLTVLVFHLWTIVRQARLSLFAISIQFFMRGMLLFIQVVNPEGYREVNNWVSTPAVLFVLVCVIINLWQIRSD